MSAIDNCGVVDDFYKGLRQMQLHLPLVCKQTNFCGNQYTIIYLSLVENSRHILAVTNNTHIRSMVHPHIFFRKCQDFIYVITRHPNMITI